MVIASDCNATRGIFAGGNTPVLQPTIQFITMATLGNASEFGDQSVNQEVVEDLLILDLYFGEDMSLLLIQISLDYVKIPTQGDCVDFGDQQFKTSMLVILTVTEVYNGNT